MKARLEPIALLTLTLMLMPPLAGCYGLSKSPSASKAGRGSSASASDTTTDPAFDSSKFFGDGLSAYRQTVYPLATKHCASCHGASQSPMFAVADVSAAYKTMLGTGKISFPDTASSALLQPGNKLSDSHCGSYCNGSSVAEWKSAIQAWWVGGECAKTGACGNSGPGTGAAARVSTAPQTVPADLPSAAGSFTTLTFALDPIGADLAGAAFVVDMQQYGSSNGYLLRRPRISFPSGANYSIYVRDIQIAINGAIDPNATTYEIVEQTVSPPGGQLLSLSPLITTQQKGPGTDQVAISFGALQKSAGACKSVAVFSQNVKPILLNDCTGCHASQSTFRINSADSDTILCSRALQRVNLGQPELSPLIRLPKYGDPERDGTPHSKPSGFTDADVTTILDWVSKEH